MTKSSRCPLREHFRGECPEPAEIDRQQRKNGAELNQDRKRFAKGIVTPAEHMLHQQQVARRRYRQKFCQTLDNSEDGRLDQVNICRSRAKRGRHRGIQLHEQLRGIFADLSRGLVSAFDAKAPVRQRKNAVIHYDLHHRRGFL